ncbi:MAG TPA: NAD-dependent epimerase/dehydratase family protein [Ktedonobacterales bacterium]|jgi:UDP-glucose 4-epimerase
MRVLITGGAGFIGSHLVDRLLTPASQPQEPLYEILVFDNLRHGSMAHLEPHLSAGRIRFIEGDIRDEAGLSAALAGVEIVFHLAAQANVIGSEADPDYAFTTNVVGVYNVLKAAEAAGVRRLLFSSSREVYGEPETLPVREDARLAPKNAYGASKVAGEMYVQVAQARGNMETVIFRLANVYGPRDSERVIPLWLRRARRGEELLLYGGEQLIDFVWVADVTEAFAQAALADRQTIAGERINIGTGIGTPLAEVAARVLTLTASRSEMRVIPARGAEVRRFVADPGKLQRLLNLEPEPPLAHLPEMAAALAGDQGEPFPTTNPTIMPIGKNSS